MVFGLPDRLREWWAVEDPDERIEGTGNVVPEPAYNSHYGGERELERLAAAGDDDGPDPGREP